MVLGTAANNNGELCFSPPAKSRCDRAAEAYYNSRFKRGEASLLIAGGYADWLFEEPPIKREALVMADYLINTYNIPANALLLEDQSTDTEKNFTFSRDMFPEFFKDVIDGERKLAVVSHQNHLDKATHKAIGALACSVRQLVLLPTREPFPEEANVRNTEDLETKQDILLAADF